MYVLYTGMVLPLFASTHSPLMYDCLFKSDGFLSCSEDLPPLTMPFGMFEKPFVAFEKRATVDMVYKKRFSRVFNVKILEQYARA